ncbi:hypothetical protein ACFRIC_17775 [Streptomyces sp. NPDC056738]|uniref:hypothetical protein n=1 Tax=Streptomyces sp. NPDC056738 TaxID=3345933 RepID=UPI003690F4B5
MANEAVAAFHRELTDRFPELSSTVDDDALAEASPWAAGLDVSAAHVIMAMSWSRADGTAPEVVDLAGRHGLVCLDPQAQVLHRPPAQRGADGLSLRPCVGLTVEDADPEVIERAVRRLSAENWFLILERRSGYFLQVGHGPNAGLATDGFAVEHREGSMERHYRCVLSGRDEVAALFADYAAGANTHGASTRSGPASSDTTVFGGDLSSPGVPVIMPLERYGNRPMQAARKSRDLYRYSGVDSVDRDAEFNSVRE